MKYLFIALIGLFLSPLHAMEITKNDFVFKDKSDREFFSDQKSKPCSFKNNNDDLSRTFANHELLWAQRNDSLPQDVKNIILHIRFQQIMDNDDYEIKTYDFDTPLADEIIINDKNIERREKYERTKDVFWANRGQQKAMYYLMHIARHTEANHSIITERADDIFWADRGQNYLMHTTRYTPEKRNIIIEGADSFFLQEMAQQIDSLSRNMKLKILERSNNMFYIQTDAGLKERQIKKQQINRQLFFIQPCIRAIFFTAFLYTCLKTNNTEFKQGLGFAMGGMLRAIAFEKISTAGCILEGLLGLLMLKIIVKAMVSDDFFGPFFFLLGTATPFVFFVANILGEGVIEDFMKRGLKKGNNGEQLVVHGFEQRYFINK